MQRLYPNRATLPTSVDILPNPLLNVGQEPMHPNHSASELKARNFQFNAATIDRLAPTPQPKALRTEHNALLHAAFCWSFTAKSRIDFPLNSGARAKISGGLAISSYKVAYGSRHSSRRCDTLSKSSGQECESCTGVRCERRLAHRRITPAEKIIPEYGLTAPGYFAGMEMESECYSVGSTGAGGSDIFALLFRLKRALSLSTISIRP